MRGKTTQKATGRHYFGSGGFPLTAVRVRSDGTGRASHPHDLTAIEHDHDFNELVLVTRGRAVQHLEDMDYPVQAGDVYILQRRHRHHFFQREGLELINVMYDSARLPLPDAHLRMMAGYCALFLLEPRYRHTHRFRSRLHLKGVALAHAEELAEAILKETASTEAGREAALLGHFISLVAYLSRCYERTSSVDARALLRIGETLGALERDPAHAWTLRELCGRAGMSRSHFSRVFREATGLSPIDYLIHLRLREAMRRLRAGHQSITEIALETGFSDSNYFARLFRQRVGMSPRLYARGAAGD